MRNPTRLKYQALFPDFITILGIRLLTAQGRRRLIRQIIHQAVTNLINHNRVINQVPAILTAGFLRGSAKDDGVES